MPVRAFLQQPHGLGSAPPVRKIAAALQPDPPHPGQAQPITIHPHIVRNGEAVGLASLSALPAREILGLAVGLPPGQEPAFRLGFSVRLVETPVGGIQVLQHMSDGGTGQIAQPGQILIRVYGAFGRCQKSLELTVVLPAADHGEPFIHGLPSPAGVHKQWPLRLREVGPQPVAPGHAGHAVAPVVVRQEQIPNETVGSRRLGTQLSLPTAIKPHPVPLTADCRGCCCRIGCSSLGCHLQPACQGVVQCSHHSRLPLSYHPQGKPSGWSRGGTVSTGLKQCPCLPHGLDPLLSTHLYKPPPILSPYPAANRNERTSAPCCTYGGPAGPPHVQQPGPLGVRPSGPRSKG